MIKLKKCPFCGGAAELYHGFCGENQSYVICTVCHASTKPVYVSPEYASDEKAADVWNRRIGDPDDNN